MTRANLEDPMHQVGNNVHHVWSLAMNVGPEEFTRKRRLCEVKLERFPELDFFRVDDDRYVSNVPHRCIVSFLSMHRFMRIDTSFYMYRCIV